MRELQIDEDIEFQRRNWLAERIGWTVFAVVLVGALAGLFGGSVLGRANARAAGFEIEYDRFTRRTANSELRFRRTPMLTETGSVSPMTSAPVPGAASGSFRISLPRDYLEKIEIRAIEPPPARVEQHTTHTDFVFHDVTSGRANEDVRFLVEVTAVGWVSGEIAEPGRGEARFWQLVYP